MHSVILVVLVAVAVCVLCWPSRMTFVRASNGQTYNVKAGKDAGQVAERLASLQHSTTQFLKDAARAFPAHAAMVHRIARRWDGTISEVPDDDEVAYSLDKNTIALCLRSPKTGDLETWNRSVFVLLHELAHIATPEAGHTPTFWRNMKALLELAHALGFYNDEEHRADATYCGHPLGQSPMACVRNRTCSSELKQ